MALPLCIGVGPIFVLLWIQERFPVLPAVAVVVIVKICVKKKLKPMDSRKLFLVPDANVSTLALKRVLSVFNPL